MLYESALAGTWELNEIDLPGIILEELYKANRPYITFDIESNMVAGNTGCNSFTGKLNVNGEKINFSSPMALTKMMCANEKGETVFLGTLKKINAWAVNDGSTLHFTTGDKIVMQFIKK